MNNQYGAFLYAKISPPDTLNDFFKCFWYLNNPTHHAKHYTVFPDGYFDLIIMVRDGNVVDVKVFGIWSKQIDVVAPPQTTVIGITCKPLAAEYVFRLSIGDLHNSFSPLSVNDLHIPFVDERIFDLEQFMKKFIEKLDIDVGKIDSRKRKMFDIIFNNTVFPSVEALSSQVFWQSRQMNRYFNGRFGISLKCYLNIVRCASAYHSIKEGKLNPSVSFYDQSHFIKEIKKYTGHLPKDLYRNENDRFLQFFPLPWD